MRDAGCEVHSRAVRQQSAQGAASRSSWPQPYSETNSATSFWFPAEVTKETQWPRLTGVGWFKFRLNACATVQTAES